MYRLQNKVQISLCCCHWLEGQKYVGAGLLLIKLLPPPMTNASLANDHDDHDAEQPLISAESDSLQPSDVQLHTDEDALVWS